MYLACLHVYVFTCLRFPIFFFSSIMKPGVFLCGPAASPLQQLVRSGLCECILVIIPRSNEH